MLFESQTTLKESLPGETIEGMIEKEEMTDSKILHTEKEEAEMITMTLAKETIPLPDEKSKIKLFFMILHLSSEIIINLLKPILMALLTLLLTYLIFSAL